MVKPGTTLWKLSGDDMIKTDQEVPFNQLVELKGSIAGESIGSFDKIEINGVEYYIHPDDLIEVMN